MKSSKTYESNSYHGLLLLLIPLSLLFFSCTPKAAKEPVVQLVKLEIDTAQLDNYKSALKDEIETSMRVEPGVLNLSAVYDKDNPTHVTVFEIYADKVAYKAHLESPHFKKYKSSTLKMVKSLELTKMVPIALERNNR